MKLDHSRIDKLYREFLRNKTVAVVGGAENAVDFQAVKLCDVVVCCNHVYERLEKTQVVYYHGGNTEEHKKRDRKMLTSARYLKFVFTCCTPPFPRVFDGFENWANYNEIEVGGYLCGRYPEVNPIAPELELFNVLSKKLDTRPFTGFCAIEHLLSMPIKRLLVTGFTFYRDNTGFPEQVGPHNVPFHVRYLDELLATDARVVVPNSTRSAMHVCLLQYNKTKKNEDYRELKSTIVDAVRELKTSDK